MKIMLLSVDWSVLDARIPPYTKQIIGRPNLSEFRYSVDESPIKNRGAGQEEVNACLDLEENLLSNDEGQDSGSFPHGNNSSFVPVAISPRPPPPPSDISSVSSGGVGSGVSGWTGSRSDVADRLLFMFSGEEDLNVDAASRDQMGSDQETHVTPLARMLAGAGVPSDMRKDSSLEHLDAEIVIELFSENQSITAFIEELSKFDVPRIISSKLFMHLKSLVKGMH